MAALLAALGLALGAGGRDIVSLIAGYGLLFGIASGIGYSRALATAVSSWPERRGLVTGILVCAYPFGAAVAAPALRWSLEAFGPWPTLLAMAASFLALAPILGLLLSGDASSAHLPAAAPDRVSRGETPIFLLMWAGFFFGACAGLLVIGHAAGVAAEFGGATGPIAVAVAAVALANGCGRLLAGWASDTVPVKHLLSIAPFGASIAIAAALIWPEIEVVIAALTATGLAYGVIAAGYAVAVTILFGVARLPRLFGRLFTARGAAGLVAPWTAGVLHDITGGYRTALILAAVFALLAGLAAALIPARRHQD